jgi:SAM-dependent methyltransferase
MADEVGDRCAWCGESSNSPPWPGRREPPDFQIRRCGGCGHHYTVPVLDAAAIGAYYPDAYYGNWNKRFNPVMERLVGRFRRRRATKLTRFVRPGKVLDIGCGRGLTLAALRELGWQVKGCELSPAASRHAREVLGLDVVCDGFRPDQVADGEYDAIILWHVFEHLANPREVLAACARALRPGGVLALAVPNFDSWQARATHYGWFHLDLPRHYSHFSAPWLRERFAELGLRIVHEYHGSLEQNPYGWIQSVLNAAGLRFNLLYDILRNRSARTTKHPWIDVPFQSLASVVGATFLLPFALMMWLPEIFRKRGATVDFYAVRDAEPAV